MQSEPGTERRGGLARSFAILVVAVICFKLLFLQIWLWNNDNYITLSTFFSSAGRPDYVEAARKFYAASVASCSAGDARCVAFSATLHTEQTYSRPIVAYFGELLADPLALQSAETLTAAITRVTVFHVAASTALVIALLALFLAALPGGLGPYLATTLALFAAVGYWLPERGAFAEFQPLLGVGAAGAAGVLAVGAIAVALARAGSGWQLAQRLTRAVHVGWVAVVALLVARVALARMPELYAAIPLPGAGVGLLATMLAAAAFVVFAGATAAAMQASLLPPSARWVAAFLLLGLVSTGENFFSTAFHIAPRGQVYLLTAPLFVYAAFRPNGRLLWLLPLFLLFHVSIAGLLYGSIIAVEAVAGLRRRSVSLALLLSLPLLVIAGVQTSLSGVNAVVTEQATSASTLVSRLDALAFAPAVVVLAVLAAAAYAAWRLPDPAGDLLLRAVVLGALVAVAGQVRYAINAAGLQGVDPAAYNYWYLAYYLGPIVCAAAIFLVMIALASEAPASEPVALNRLVLTLMALAVVALATARSTNTVGRPPDPLAVIARSIATVTTGRAPAPPGALVMNAAAAGDHYLIGASVGDDVSTMSILKLRLRAVTGLLDPEAMTAAPAVSRAASR